jgi:hypothetical protein
LGLEYYRLDDYKIVQVDNNDWSKEV